MIYFSQGKCFLQHSTGSLSTILENMYSSLQLTRSPKNNLSYIHLGSSVCHPVCHPVCRPVVVAER